MAEIIALRDGESVAANRNHVLITRVNGKFVASGSAGDKSVALSFTPEPFDTKDEAFAAASRWADANLVPAIYIADNVLATAEPS